MSLHYDKTEQAQLRDKFVFIDTNVLAESFKDEQFLESLTSLFPERQFLVDPLVKFEFLRDTYLPEEVRLRHEFISDENYFIVTPDNQSIFSQVQKNAILLSRILRHKNQKSVPIVDLFVMAKVALYSGSSVLVTRDFTDFTSILFDRLNIFTFTRQMKNKEEILHFQIVSFNNEKFAVAENELIRLQAGQ